jgi:hypothetical protein
MTLTDEELDRIAGFESFDRCPATLQDLIAQAKEANRLRAALAECIDIAENWSHKTSDAEQQRYIDRLAELRKLTETK